MNHVPHTMLANGMVILQALAYVWIAAMALAVPLTVTALVLALRRRARTAAWVLGGVGGAIGLVPILIEILLAADALLGAGWPRTAFQFVVFVISCVPTLLAAAALCISRKRPPPNPPATFDT